MSLRLDRRLRRLEAKRFDASGLVPHSEAWFAYWTDIVDRSLRGEPVDCTGITIAVFDRFVEAADRAEEAERRLQGTCLAGPWPEASGERDSEELENSDEEHRKASRQTRNTNSSVSGDRAARHRLREHRPQGDRLPAVGEDCTEMGQRGYQFR